MRQMFTIEGNLDGLNEYTAACRSSDKAGWRMKKNNEHRIAIGIRRANLVPMEGPVTITVLWREGIKPGKSRFVARDKDNVRFAIKFIQDALVAMGILKDDSWKNVTPFDVYEIDRDRPQVTVVISDEDEDKDGFKWN